MSVTAVRLTSGFGSPPYSDLLFWLLITAAMFGGIGAAVAR